MKTGSWILYFAMTLLIYSSMSFSVYAEEQVNPNQSTDSRFTITETFNVPAHWAWIKLSKDLYSEDIIVPVEDGQMSKLLYLKLGTGQYNVQVYYSNNLTKAGASYYKLKEFDIINLDTRDLSFLLPSENVQSEDPAIVALAENLVMGVDSDSEKAKIIHDFVAGQLSYDYDSYYNGTYKKNKYDALTVLNSHVSVCSGYANLFAALGRAAHLRVAVIHGKGVTTLVTGAHAWNEVFIDNEWKSVDVTWDDMKVLRYNYFLQTEEEFSKDHLEREVRAGY